MLYKKFYAFLYTKLPKTEAQFCSTVTGYRNFVNNFIYYYI